MKRRGWFSLTKFILGSRRMSYPAPAVFSTVVSDRIRTRDEDLAHRWLGRLQAVIPVHAVSIFPTADLLDHIPALIREIADFLAVQDQDIVANTFVLSKARELGLLRHAQQASAHQLLREYELLRGILHTFVLEEVVALELTPSASEVLQLVRKIDHAIGVLTQVTVDTFIQRYTETIGEQTRRLEQFNRLVSHELRQPLGVLHIAAKMMGTAAFSEDPDRRKQTVQAIDRNISRLADLVETITRLTQSTRSNAAGSAPGVQQIQLSQMMSESARQLRDLADARSVEMKIASDLPEVIVDVGQLDLLATNLLSNAIKYHDPQKASKYVKVTNVVTDRGCAFQITDNGVGMTEEQLKDVFTPFWRGHPEAAEGIGLGMAIVSECAAAIGATIGVESGVGVGTTFTITLPLRACAAELPPAATS